MKRVTFILLLYMLLTFIPADIFHDFSTVIALDPYLSKNYDNSYHVTNCRLVLTPSPNRSTFICSSTDTYPKALFSKSLAHRTPWHNDMKESRICNEKTIITK